MDAQMTQNGAPQDGDLSIQSNHALLGTLGALLGAVVGAIPWAIVYVFGFIVGWLGLFIGYAVKKGYALLGGKDCAYAKFITVLFVIFGILLGVFAGETIQAWRSYDEADAETREYYTREEYIETAWNVYYMDADAFYGRMHEIMSKNDPQSQLIPRYTFINLMKAEVDYAQEQYDVRKALLTNVGMGLVFSMIALFASGRKPKKNKQTVNFNDAAAAESGAAQNADVLPDAAQTQDDAPNDTQSNA